MSNAKRYFEEIIRRHVISVINIQNHTVNICKKITGNVGPIKILEDERYWRDFMPPLYNYLITGIEVYLEHYFVEKYKKPNNGKYINKDDWLADLENFKSTVTWPNKNAKNKIHKNFSFQNLDSVDVLYESAFGINISNYSKYDLIRLMFAKRHLFTHRAGILDEKFINIHNQYHGSETSNLLDRSNLGKKAFIERSWIIAQ